MLDRRMLPGAALALALGAAGCLTGFGVSEAGASETKFPTRAVRVIVPYPAGGVVDLFARAVTESLAARWKQPVVVEAQPGADTQVATNNVLRSEPDGYTMLISGPALVATPALHPSAKWDATRDFAGVGIIGYSPNAFVVSPKLPVRTVAEFVDYAKARPGEISAGVNAGASTYFNQEALKLATGIKLLTVPYRGAPPIAQDMVGGNVMFAVLPGIVAAPFVQSGQLRALAIVSDKRVDMFPGVPTMAEAGYPAANVQPWYGFVVSRKTPPEVVKEINAAVNAALHEDALKERLAKIGGVAAEPMTPEAVDAFIAADGEKLVRIIREANMKP